MSLYSYLIKTPTIRIQSYTYLARDTDYATLDSLSWIPIFNKPPIIPQHAMNNSESGPSSIDELVNMFGAQNLSPLTIRIPPLNSDRLQKHMEDSTKGGKRKGKQKEIVKENDDDELDEVEIIDNSTTDKDKRDGAGILNNATSLKVGDSSRSGVTKASFTSTKTNTERIPSSSGNSPVAQNPTSYRTRPINTNTGRPDCFSWREKPKPKRVHYKSSRSLRGITESHPTEQVDSASTTSSEQKARRMAASAKIRGVRRRGRPDALDVTEGLYSTINPYGKRPDRRAAMRGGESFRHNVSAHISTKASSTAQDLDDLPSYEEVEKEFASAIYAVISAPKPAPKAVSSSVAASASQTSVPKRIQQPISSLSPVHASGSRTPASTVRANSDYARGPVAPSASIGVDTQTGETECAPQMVVSTFIRANSGSSTLTSGASMDGVIVQGAEQPTASSSRSSKVPVSEGTVPPLQRTPLGKSDTMMSVVEMDTDTTSVNINLRKIAGRRLCKTSSSMNIDDPTDTRSGRPSTTIIGEDSEMAISEATIPSRSQTMSVTMIDVRDIDIDMDIYIQPASVGTSSAGSPTTFVTANRATQSANLTADPRSTTSNVVRWAPQSLHAPAPRPAFVPSFAPPFIPSPHRQAPQQPPKKLVLGLNESLHLSEAAAQRVSNGSQYPSSFIPLPADAGPSSQTYLPSSHRTILPESIPSQEPFWDQVHNMASHATYHPLNFGSFSSSPSQDIARGNKQRSRHDLNTSFNGVKFTRPARMRKWKHGYRKHSSHISCRGNSTAAASELLTSVPLISLSPPQPRLRRRHQQESSSPCRFSWPLRHIPFYSDEITSSQADESTGSTGSSGNIQSHRERSCGWVWGICRVW